MSDLDKKLEKIIASGQPTARAQEDLINEIKETFIDDGWARKEWLSVGTVNGEQYRHLEAMTGQEFYARFEKEFSGWPKDSVVTVETNSVLDAVKRAAGIE